MGYCTSRGVGQYVASETHDFVWHRRTGKGIGKGVISCSGSHSTADALTSSDWRRASALADAGFVVISGDMSQTASQGTYGNDTVQTRIGQLLSFVQGAIVVPARSGKVHLMGGSGGCTAAINYARANPANVASMYLIVPLVDVEDFYSSTLGGTANGQSGPASGITQSEINKAYNNGVDDGGTAYTAAMPTHNPIRSGNQAALSGIPMKLAYADNDPYINVAKVTTYASLVNQAGGNAIAYSQGSVGHTDNGVDPQDVVAFFRANP